MRMLGIDPGATTGFCLLEDGAVIDDSEVVFDDVLDTDVVETYISLCNAVAVERYFITARSVKLSRQNEALYVTGIVLYVAHRHAVPLTLQSAADAKSAFTNEHLREMGLFRAVTGPHARDALRHALLAERRMRLA